MRKEAPLAMQSSATVAIRAFVMLACAVGIPVLAMSGASWSEIVKKFQNLRCPAIVNLASASTPTRPATSDLALLAEHGPTIAPPTVAPPLPDVPRDPVPSATPTDIRDIQQRLQKLGATYYVLESWGNGQQLYRFFCKMAVAGSADYVQCFEATHADPLQAMQQVLQQVETWHGAAHGPANVGS